MTEAELVAAVARGDRQAFTHLATAHAPKLEAYVLRLSGSASLAQDVVQEVLLKLWLNAARFDASRSRLTTWLHRMAHNLCIDVMRDTTRRQDMSVRLADERDNMTHEQDMSGTDGVVGQALLALPERQRSALVLTYYQELSNREVADVMSISVRALESLLVRARAALRDKLEGSDV